MSDKSVLLVDDEVQILKMMSKVLVHKGFSVTCAESAEEALDAVEKERFRMAFIDLNLSEMNGIELGHRIRQKDDEIALYAMSGYADAGKREACLENGFNGFYEKPVSMYDILALLG